MKIWNFLPLKKNLKWLWNKVLKVPKTIDGSFLGVRLSEWVLPALGSTTFAAMDRGRVLLSTTFLLVISFLLPWALQMQQISGRRWWARIVNRLLSTRLIIGWFYLWHCSRNCGTDLLGIRVCYKLWLWLQSLSGPWIRWDFLCCRTGCSCWLEGARQVDHVCCKPR